MRSLIIIFSFAVSTHLISQDSLKFISTVYVKDALGNIDSVIIGTSFYAGFYFNPQFGEIDLKTPFDSLLEIRAGHVDGPWDFLNENYILSKKIISGSERIEGKSGVPIRLFIHAKYQPVTISWAKDFLDKKYFLGTYMTPDANMATVNPIFYWETFPVRFQCMNKFTEYTVELTQRAVPEFEYPYHILRKIEGSTNSVDSIFGVQIVFEQHEMYSPCQLVSTVKEEKKFSTLNIWPNPVMDYLQISNNITQLEIYNLEGQLIRTIKDKAEFFVGDFGVGLYLLRAKSIDGVLLTGKFIKN